MNFFKHLKVGSRLGLGFGLVLILLVVTALLGIDRMGRIEAGLENIAKVNNRETQLAVAMRIAVNQVAIASRDIALLTDAAEMQAVNEGLEKSRAHYDAAEAELGKMFSTIPDTTPKEKELFASIRELKAKAQPLVDKVVTLGLANKADEAGKILTHEVKPAQRPWLDALGQLADLEDKLSAEAADQATQDYAQARFLLLATTLAAILVGALLAWLVTRSITTQLGGEPDYAAEVAGEIAKGNLAVDVQVRAGDTSSLLAAMGAMRESLAQVVASVRQSSDSIATGSSQIASGNADLSQRTEEQASNLQQTAASMEELTATVRQNSETAQEANQLASSASLAATEGGAVVDQVVSTMDAITASSKKISDIISVIDGIAFQTNILALNAAVEAARAGEQGRGFAVVASEVRSLAQRSASAAKEIKSLIGESVEKVETGSKLVGDAGRSMHNIVTQVKRVNDLIAEISAASMEQSQGISQVGDAVAQLDQVTQQNAALVEESASAADSLSQQAARLAQVVAVFKLGAADGRRVASAAPPAHPGAAHRIAPAPAATRQKPVAARPAPARLIAKAKPGSAAAPAAASGNATTTANAAATSSNDDWENF